MQYINLNKTLSFESQIEDLLLISIDDQIDTVYDKDGVKIAGDILISGKTRTIEDEKEFCDKVELDIFLTDDEIDNRNELKVNVNDFTYNIEDNKLVLNISLKIEGLKEIETTFLTEENNETFKQEEINEIEEENVYIDIDINVNEDREKEENLEESVDLKEEPEKRSLLKTVFSSKRINEEVSWKLHCVKEEKSYEEIANKYNISIDKLKNINKNESIEEGKLIFIPLD